MKVTALMSGLWYGGAQTSTLEFLEALRGRKGIELEVMICDSSDKRLILDLMFSGVKYYEVTCKNILGFPIMHFNDVMMRKVRESDLVWITDLEHLTIKYTSEIRVPVVLYLHSYALACPLQTSLYRFERECIEKCSIRRLLECKNIQTAGLRFLGKNSVTTFYDRLLGIIKVPFNYATWVWQVRNVLGLINAYIFVSNKHRYLYMRHLPEIFIKHNTVIYNIVTRLLKHVKVDIEDQYDNYILYASGSNPTKGPYLLLEAWSKISKEFKDLKLLMTGCKGTQIEKLIKRRADLSNVVLLNKLPPDMFYQLMYKARAVVMPSIWPEPFGRIPVEANRLGVPAVVSSAGGLPETIIDGATGYIFEAGDVDDLAKKVIKVLERDFNREKIIKYSYEKINPQREVEKLIKFFESVISYGGRV
jgi:glycosyltransferase involved in cell wall biosynthesis